MTRLITLLSICALASACGSSSPTSPSPPTPPPAVVLSLTADQPTPTGNVLWMETAQEATTGQIAVNLNVRVGAGFSMFRATLIFDPAILHVVSYSEGPFLKQGGAVLDTVASFADGTSTFVVRSDRPSSLVAASGSGTVIVVRFAPAGTVRAGRSPVQWSDTHAYTTSFADINPRAFGGAITLQ